MQDKYVPSGESPHDLYSNWECDAMTGASSNDTDTGSGMAIGCGVGTSIGFQQDKGGPLPDHPSDCWLASELEATLNSLPTDAGSDCISVGTVGHPLSCGIPCKFRHRPRGCKDGEMCKCCHKCKFCPWMKKKKGKAALVSTKVNGFVGLSVVLSL